MSTNRTVSVTGWTMAGACFRNGFRFPGYTLVCLSDGESRYFPEQTAIAAALELCRKAGIDTREAEARLETWVDTGQGASFTLK